MSAVVVDTLKTIKIRKYYAVASADNLIARNDAAYSVIHRVAVQHSGQQVCTTHPFHIFIHLTVGDLRRKDKGSRPQNIVDLA